MRDSNTTYVKRQHLFLIMYKWIYLNLFYLFVILKQVSIPYQILNHIPQRCIALVRGSATNKLKTRITVT